jgi:hypothetical protein
MAFVTIAARFPPMVTLIVSPTGAASRPGHVAKQDLTRDT